MSVVVVIGVILVGCIGFFCLAYFGSRVSDRENRSVKLEEYLRPQKLSDEYEARSSV